MIRPIHGDVQAQHVRDASDARRFASSIIRARQEDEAFDARAVLSEFPELEGYGSAVLDLVYEEFSRRSNAGEEFDSQEFADRFPEFRSAVLEHIRAHQLLEKCFGDNSPAWPDAGDTVLECKLLEEIGRGAFSRVFLATQSALGGRRVVVKFCPSGAHEAQLLGKLEHENIVQVHAVECDSARRLNAIVMPFHGRATLRAAVDVCFSGKPNPRTAAALAESVRRIGGDEARTTESAATIRGSYTDAIVQIMLDVGRGLAHAHGKAVLHADIKPSNVLLTGALRAKLLDFNLSHDSSALTNMTGGTLPYMAPEQLQALAQQREPAPTAAADLYAFGATMYECLTGRSPYGGIPAGLDRTTLAQWLLQRRQGGWEPCGRAAPHVPGPIRKLVDDCLSVDPLRRPNTIDEAVAILSREQRRSVRLLRNLQRHPWVTGVIGGSLTIAVIAVIVSNAMADPAHVDYFSAGHREFVTGNFERAIHYFNLAERNLPADASQEFQIALRYERGRAGLQRHSQEAYDASFRDFERVIELNKDCAAAHASLAYARVIEFNGNAHTRNFLTEFTMALDEFQRAHELGLDTDRLQYDIEFCRSQTPEQRDQGLAGLLDLVENGEAEDLVRASAFLAIARAALVRPGVVKLPSQDVRELLTHVGHSPGAFLKAGRAYLDLADVLATKRDRTGAAQALDNALACLEVALQHGAPSADIGELVNSHQMTIGRDERFLRISPAGELIPASPEPLAILDPLGEEESPGR